MKQRVWLLLSVVSLAFAGILWALQGHDENPDFPAIPSDHTAIHYSEPSNDPVAHLVREIEKGEATLEFQPKWGYLPSLLQHLGINPDSQLLVFSKTSSQVEHISPATPRAIYFNDEVAVGYVQGGRALEIASLDPSRGMIFYTLDMQRSDPPSFGRQDMACLQCHMSPATLNIPGIMVSSVYPTDEQSPYGRRGSYVTDHRTPIEDRWGGWYVTGLHGAVHHRGNTPVDGFAATLPESDLPASQNLKSLEGRLNIAAYMSPGSDIVALMALEHQTHMVSLFIRIGWETRVAIADGNLKEFSARLDSDVEEIVSYMLFSDEAPLRAPIRGVSTFTQTFSQRGPRDQKGRSLRDFDLHQRMFRYPLSYMIYSEAFDAIPGIARERIYQRLFDVLTGKDSTKQFAGLSADDRRAIIEILRDTKPNLPAYWKASAPAAQGHDFKP